MLFYMNGNRWQLVIFVLCSTSIRLIVFVGLEVNLVIIRWIVEQI